MATSIDFTGPVGGILAIAYGAGAASGWFFCLRTMYKLLADQSKKVEDDCKVQLEEERAEHKLTRERLLLAMDREKAQIHQSLPVIFGRQKLVRFEDEEE